MKIRDSYDAVHGVSTCTIIYKGREFIGRAYIHPDDEDMQSERTGSIIAQARATIKLNKYILNSELRPSLTALNHVYEGIKRSKNFNEKSYENKRLRAEIQNYKNEIAVVSNKIAGEELHLKDYIDLKDKFYKEIRRKRKLDKKD